MLRTFTSSQTDRENGKMALHEVKLCLLGVSLLIFHLCTIVSRLQYIDSVLSMLHFNQL